MMTDYFASNQYGFAPNIILQIPKEQNTSAIIKHLRSQDVTFAHKTFAYATTKETVFSNNDFKTAPLTVTYLGQYFDKQQYVFFDNQAKCVITNIRETYKKWSIDVSKCLGSITDTKLLHKGRTIPFTLLKRRNSHKLIFKQLDTNEQIVLYEYLVELLQQYAPLSTLGITPPLSVDKKIENERLQYYEYSVRPILASYFSLMYPNKNYIPALSSKELSKNINAYDKLKTEVFSSIGAQMHRFLVIDSFSSGNSKNIILMPFRDDLFKGYKDKIIYFYTQEPKKLTQILHSLGKGTIHKQEPYVQLNPNAIAYSLFALLGVILFGSALIGAIRFYKDFKQELVFLQLHGDNTPYYTLVVGALIVGSSVFAWGVFLYLLSLVNGYIALYFYPPLLLSIDPLIVLGAIFIFLVIIRFYEKTLSKDLKLEY